MGKKRGKRRVVMLVIFKTHWFKRSITKINEVGNILDFDHTTANCEEVEKPSNTFCFRYPCLDMKKNAKIRTERKNNLLILFFCFTSFRFRERPTCSLNARLLYPLRRPGRVSRVLCCQSFSFAPGVTLDR